VNNCLQCSVSSVTICAQCKVGYYLETQVCKSCESICRTCTQLQRCQSCIEGYFLIRTDGVSTGKCGKCSSDCVTCSEFSDQCTECQSGKVLTSSGNCVSENQISTTTTFDMNIEEYTAKAKQIQEYYLSLLGSQYVGSQQYFLVRRVNSGSTVVEASLAIPEGEDADAALSSVSSGLGGASTISGIPVTSTSTQLVNVN
jgi:hypothetical protein